MFSLHKSLSRKGIVFLTSYQSSFVRLANWGEILVGEASGRTVYGSGLWNKLRNWTWASQGAVCKFVPPGRNRQVFYWVSSLWWSGHPVRLVSLALKSFLFRVDHWNLFQPHRALEYHWERAGDHWLYSSGLFKAIAANVLSGSGRSGMTCGVRVPSGFLAAFLAWCYSCWCPHHRAICPWLFVFLYCRCVFMDHRHRQRVATTTAKNRDIRTGTRSGSFFPCGQGRWPSKLYE